MSAARSHGWCRLTRGGGGHVVYARRLLSALSRVAHCRDDPKFVDAHKVPCRKWTGYSCGRVTSLTRSVEPAHRDQIRTHAHRWLERYTGQELEEVRAHCNRACRTCPPQPSPPPALLSVSFHYRLGDVYNGGFAGNPKFSYKMLSPNWIVFALLLLRRVMPLDCALYPIFTDGHASDPPLEAMVKMLKSHSLPVPRIMSNNAADARAAFEGLSRSDVLVTGTSGFGRFAAAANPGVVIAAELGNSSRLGSIPNVIEFDVTDMKMGWQLDTDHTWSRDKSGGVGRWQGSFETAYEAAHLPAWEHHAEKLKRVFEEHIRTRRPELAPMLLLANGPNSPCGAGMSS